MTETNISICSRALVLLGAEPISSFNDGTDASKVCANVYEGIKRNMIAQYGWRFLMVKKNLTRDTVAPVGEWKYSYIIPGDAVALTHAIFSSGQHAISSGDYEIFGRRIYTNHEVVIADYVTDGTEGTWPAYFVELMVYAVCANIAFAITDQQGVADSWQVKAFGTPSENGQGGMMGIAKTIDSQADPNPGFKNDEFLQARYGNYNGAINHGKFS